MKKIHRDTLPACDICKSPAKYDAPTVLGSWANMCEECFPAMAANYAPSTGYVFTTEPEKAMTDDELAQELRDAVWSGDFDLADELLGDRDPAEFL